MDIEKLISDILRYIEVADEKAASGNFDESYDNHVGRGDALAGVLSLLRGKPIEDVLVLYEESYPTPKED